MEEAAYRQLIVEAVLVYQDCRSRRRDKQRLSMYADPSLL